MPRYFVPITKEELATKLYETALKKDPECFDGGWNNSKNYKYDSSTICDFITKECYYFQPKYLTPIIEHDLMKINFDDENVCADSGPLDGFRTLDNNFVFFGVTAGGDWELPIFFIIYWDGEHLRAYIPTDGNTFNPKTKAAYGNEDDYDLEKLYGVTGDDAEKIRTDIENIIEEQKNIDVIKVIADIKNRLQKKE